MVFQETSSSTSAVPTGAIWASMASWFTPSVLFVVINLVIGTIAVTSKSSHHHRADANRNREDECQPPLITRGSSVFGRLRSVNLLHYAEALVPVPAAVATVEAAPAGPADEDEGEKGDEEEGEFDGFETLEEAYEAVAGARNGNFRRSHSDSHPVEVAKEEKKNVLRKSASTSTTVFREYEAAEEEETRQRGTTRDDRRGHLAAGDDDDDEDVVGGGGEVDARADDFISRFRKQLQLQRLESILRYKEMLNRGK